MAKIETDNQKTLLTASKLGNLRLKDMQSNDLSAVLNIEHSAQASPWSSLSFEESMSKQHRCRVIEMTRGSSTATSVGCLELVAYHVVCEIVDELHILNVVTATKFQGSGLGHMLMADIVEFAVQRGLSKLFLEVRASNTIAQSLYLKWQFNQIALRKKYYRPASKFGLREDALVYMRKL